jgi:hypothetical protein
MAYYLHKVYFSCQNLNFYVQDVDTHWLGSLDPNPHKGKKLDSDQH